MRNSARALGSAQRSVSAGTRSSGAAAAAASRKISVVTSTGYAARCAARQRATVEGAPAVRPASDVALEDGRLCQAGQTLPYAPGRCVTDALDRLQVLPRGTQQTLEAAEM